MRRPAPKSCPPRWQSVRWRKRRTVFSVPRTLSHSSVSQFPALRGGLAVSDMIPVRGEIVKAQRKLPVAFSPSVGYVIDLSAPKWAVSGLTLLSAFPDVNPAWLFYGEEPMYKTATPPTPEQEETDATYLNNVAPNAATGDTLFPQFVFAEEEERHNKREQLREDDSGVRWGSCGIPIDGATILCSAVDE